MSLAYELAATNELLRAAVRPPRPAPPPPPNPCNRPTTEVRGSTALVALYAFGGLNVLRDHFVKAGTQFYERDGRDARITCPCGEAFDLHYGQVRSCVCNRLWFCGKEVYAARAPDPEPPHTCEPEILTLPTGAKVRADYCKHCRGDL